MACPCKDCPQKGCGSYHDQCEKYQSWSAEQKRIKQQQREEQRSAKADRKYGSGYW